MSWRPRGWKKTRRTRIGMFCGISGLTIPPETVGLIYEASADALLEALRRMGSPASSSHIDSDMEGGEGLIITTGRWVFIPDEEEE